MPEGVRRDEEFSGTRPVEERHRIDEANLDRWLRGHEAALSPRSLDQIVGEL